jgi:hypothetical protein
LQPPPCGQLFAKQQSDNVVAGAMFVLEHFANDCVTSCAQLWVLRHFEWPKLGAKWELGEKFIQSLRISNPQAEESVAMCQQCLSTNRMLRQPLSGGRSEFCNEGLAFLTLGAAAHAQNGLYAR